MASCRPFTEALDRLASCANRYATASCNVYRSISTFVSRFIKLAFSHIYLAHARSVRRHVKFVFNNSQGSLS